MTYLTNKIVRASKPYPCVWCPEMIESGHECRYRAYRFDGVFQTDRMHLECYAAMRDHGDLKDGFTAHTFLRGSIKDRYDAD